MRNGMTESKKPQSGGPAGQIAVTTQNVQRRKPVQKGGTMLVVFAGFTKQARDLI